MSRPVVLFRVLSRTILSHCPPAPCLNSRRLTLLQTLGHREKSQLLWNQANPDSFSKTPGVGCTLKSHPSTISNLRTLAAGCSGNLVNVSLARSPFVFIALRVAFSATHLFSKSSALPWRVSSLRPLRSGLSALRVNPLATSACRPRRPPESKLSVARISGSEQKLRSARILSLRRVPHPCGFGKGGFLAFSPSAH
jgi:hypothetical protein